MCQMVKSTPIKGKHIIIIIIISISIIIIIIINIIIIIITITIIKKKSSLKIHSNLYFDTFKFEQ